MKYFVTGATGFVGGVLAKKLREAGHEVRASVRDVDKAKDLQTLGVQLFKGDVTEKNVLWRYYKSLPNAPSPLYYQGIVYLSKEGGILTTLDAETGQMLKQGRLPGALDFYYASPIAGDGKIFAVSQEGHISVIKAGRDWEVLARNDMDDECFATPALVDGRIYVRTKSALYCFAKRD